MPDSSGSGLKVGLISEYDEQGRRLECILEDTGLQVVRHFRIDQLDIAEVKDTAMDIILIELEDETGDILDQLELLIEEVDVPLLFNEGDVPKQPGWGGKLRKKLETLVARYPTQPHPEPVLAPPEAEPDKSSPSPTLQIVSSQSQRHPRAEEVWVLGASLGGPQAVKAFLNRLRDREFPVGLVLAQHIGASFVPLLAAQLQRACDVQVVVAESARQILAGEVTLVPVDWRFTLAEDGRIQLTDEPIPGSYRPCIDDVMLQALACYKHRTHAVVFSGMGDDSSRGSAAIVRAGGTVLAQSADTCVISSMPDNARNATTVSYSGAPEALADYMLEQVANRQEMMDH